MQPRAKTVTAGRALSPASKEGVKFKLKNPGVSVLLVFFFFSDPVNKQSVPVSAIPT